MPARDSLQQVWEKRLSSDEERMPAHIGYEAEKHGKQGDRVCSLQSSYEAGFDPETDGLEPIFESHNIWLTLEAFEAAVPEGIRRIAERDHRRRTRAEKRELQARIETTGWQLLVQLGLRRG